MYSFNSNSVFTGDLLLWAVGADMSLCGFCGCGPACGDQLHLSAPEADVADGQYRQEHGVPCEQHDQPGHVRGVPHQHAGMDDTLVGAEPWSYSPFQLHGGQRGSGHHDPHEHCFVLPVAPYWLPQVQPWKRDQERQGHVMVQESTLFCIWTTLTSPRASCSTPCRCRHLCNFRWNSSE